MRGVEFSLDVLAFAVEVLKMLEHLLCPVGTSGNLD